MWLLAKNGTMWNKPQQARRGWNLPETISGLKLLIVGVRGKMTYPQIQLATLFSGAVLHRKCKFYKKNYFFFILAVCSPKTGIFDPKIGKILSLFQIQACDPSFCPKFHAEFEFTSFISNKAYLFQVVYKVVVFKLIIQQFFWYHVKIDHKNFIYSFGRSEESCFSHQGLILVLRFLILSFLMLRKGSICC